MQSSNKLFIYAILSFLTNSVFPPIAKSEVENREEILNEASQSSEATEKKLEGIKESQPNEQISLTETELSLLEEFEAFEKMEEEEKELNFDLNKFTFVPKQIGLEREKEKELKEKEIKEKNLVVFKEETALTLETTEKEAQCLEISKKKFEVSIEEESLLQLFEEFEDGEHPTTSTINVDCSEGNLIPTTEKIITIETEKQKTSSPQEESTIPTDQSVESEKGKRKQKRKHLEEGESETEPKKKKEKGKNKRKNKYFRYESSELKDVRAGKYEMAKERRNIVEKISFLSKQCAMIEQQLLLLSENQKGKSGEAKLVNEKEEKMREIELLSTRLSRLNIEIKSEEKEIKKLENEMRREKEKERFKIKEENIDKEDQEEEEELVIDIDETQEGETALTELCAHSSYRLMSFEELITAKYKFPSLTQIEKDICELTIYIVNLELLNLKNRLKYVKSQELIKREMTKMCNLEGEIALWREKLYGKEWRSFIRWKTDWKSHFKSDFLGSDSTELQKLERKRLISRLRRTRLIANLCKVLSKETVDLINIHLENIEKENKKK